MTADSETRDNNKTNYSKPPSITIVILNWNNYEDTADCLESLSGLEYPNYQVVVIDNGSTDGSGKKLQADFSWCEFLFNDENVGFAAGVNIGIKHAVNSGSDYVLLLNNDVVVCSNILPPLIESAGREGVVAVSGLIKHKDSNDIWFAGGEIHKYLARASHWRTPKCSKPYETDFITGALMMVDSEYIENRGGLNEDYFFGLEDLEFSFKATRNGHRLMIDPRCMVEHDVSSTAGQNSPFSYYQSTRNRMYFGMNNLSPTSKLLFLIVFSMTRMIRIIQWIVTAEDAKDLTIAVGLGFIDYIMKRPARKPSSFSI